MVNSSGRWGGEAEINELGDGYRSVVTIALDILAWWFVYCDDWCGQYDITDVCGIVILDEVEQHLHPNWQRKIISLLSKTFPNIQFIVTSHSPLCAAGVADTEHDSWRSVRLKNDEGLARAVEIPSFNGVSVDNILMSDAFGLTDSRNPGSEALLWELIQLMGKTKLTRKDLARMEILKERIRQTMPGSGLEQQYRNYIAKRTLDAVERPHARGHNSKRGK